MDRISQILRESIRHTEELLKLKAWEVDLTSVDDVGRASSFTEQDLVGVLDRLRDALERHERST